MVLVCFFDLPTCATCNCLWVWLLFGSCLFAFVCLCDYCAFGLDVWSLDCCLWLCFGGCIWCAFVDLLTRVWVGYFDLVLSLVA